MAHFALICPQHFSLSLSFCIITGIFSFLYTYIHINIHTYIYFLICIFCRPTGFVSHAKHKFTLFYFYYSAASSFSAFAFRYCYYYYCAESQPIIGALIVYMFVLCMFVLYVCVLLLFLSACEAPARQSHASISMRIPYATNVVCRCWRVPLCFVVVVVISVGLQVYL